MGHDRRLPNPPRSFLHFVHFIRYYIISGDETIQPDNHSISLASRLYHSELIQCILITRLLYIVLLNRVGRAV